MKNMCNFCSRNMDGVCEIYGILEEIPLNCHNFDTFEVDIPRQERLNYDMVVDSITPHQVGLTEIDNLEENYLKLKRMV